jgi:hypothetical protein
METGLLGTPFTVTTTFPVVAPNGTVSTMLVGLQLVGVAPAPLNVTVLVPCAEPKFVPVIVTTLPILAEVVDKPAMLGCWNTANDATLLAAPVTVTITLPVVAPLGTGTTMTVGLQFVAVPGVPLNVIVLLPCEEPKFTPVIVTGVPGVPELGDRLTMDGAWETVNGMALLASPPTVTTTFPVVALLGTGATILVGLQLVGVADAPLNVTVLPLCVEPKLAPVIMTEAVGTALLGDNLTIDGAKTAAVKVTETLSKVAVVKEEVVELFTISPT